MSVNFNLIFKMLLLVHLCFLSYLVPTQIKLNLTRYINDHREPNRQLQSTNIKNFIGTPMLILYYELYINNKIKSKKKKKISNFLLKQFRIV